MDEPASLEVLEWRESTTEGKAGRQIGRGRRASLVRICGHARAGQASTFDENATSRVT